jgi:Uncharacterized homolog of PrgY (pheromone shutdown protein)
VIEWVVINGGLSALGALLANAHPITILTAFLAAPLTSLNPSVGAGMVTAAVEAWIRKPRVGDFSTLKKIPSISAVGGRTACLVPYWCSYSAPLVRQPVRTLQVIEFLNN